MDSAFLSVGPVIRLMTVTQEMTRILNCVERRRNVISLLVAVDLVFLIGQSCN